MLAQIIETSLNTLLKLEEDRKSLMVPLQGLSLAVNITDLNILVFVVVAGDKFQVYLNSELTPQAELTGTSSGLIKLAMSDSPQAVLASADVELIGDIKVLNAYHLFSKQINLDWEGLLAKFTSNSIAPILAKPLKDLCSWQKRNSKVFVKDVRNYIQEEAKLSPSKAEIEDFFTDIKKLQHGIDRLETKVKRL